MNDEKKRFESNIDSMEVEGKQNWQNIPISEYYKVSFKIIDKKILLNNGDGDWSELIAENYLEKRQAVIQEAFPNNEYFVELICMTKPLNSISRQEFEKLNNFYRKENQCLGYLLYEDHPRATSRFRIPFLFKKNTDMYEMAGSFEQAIEKALLIYSRYTTAIDGGNKLKILKEWNYTYNEGTFRARLCACADNVFYVRYEGDGDEKSAKDAIDYQEKIFEQGWIVGPSYTRIADYSKFSYGSRKLREKYVKSINKIHSQYNCFPAKTYIIGASAANRIALIVLQYYLNIKSVFVKTLEEAIEQIYSEGEIKNLANDFIQVRKTDVSDVIRQMGKIAWSLLEKKESDQIADVHPLKELYDAIHLISEDYGSILRELDSKNKLLNEAIEKANLANRQKSDFLAIMTHEIRTPLNAIIGLNQYLLDTNPREDQQENLQTINYSSNHLFHLVNDILDYNKIEAGKIKLEMVAFDFRELMQNLFAPYKFWSKDKNIEYLLELDPTIPPMLVSDPTRLSQIITNLIGNAIKFTESGHVKLRVTKKELINNSATLLFEVEDTGIGIEAGNLGKIFEKYEQASDSTTRKFGGTGLGLSITKSLLELLGSSIELKSEFGKGTTFYFTLDLQIGEPKIEKKNINRQSLKNVRMLLVEDNLINVKVAMQYLKKLEMNADLANNGAEALEMVIKNDYDLVLMDINMPVMDGYEATQAIRNLENSEKANIPIIALTASSLSEVYQKYTESGMIDHISKPFTMDDLYSKILKYTHN